MAALLLPSHSINKKGDTMNMVKTFSIPSEKATKQLKFKTLSGNKRKIVISSNWLTIMNFNPDDRFVEKSLGPNKGMVINKVQDLFDEQVGKTKKVHVRSYPKRKNNPLETLLEVASQKIIDESFPQDCEKLHVIFESNRITILPISNFQAEAIANATQESRYDVFAACTSGVDLYSMENTHGFRIHSCLEWRPQEKRNKDQDLTETGALTVLRNLGHGIKNLFNEDITNINTKFIKDSMGTPVTTFIVSPQCDDFTNLKSPGSKQNSILDLSSTIDMAYDILRLIEELKPPVIVFEQVPGWYKSDIYKMLELRLRRFGYTANLLVADSRQYGGLTGRRRGYAVFSALQAPFAFEEPEAKRTGSIWDIVKKHLPMCRDVTHSKSLQDGKTTGRLRTINRESTSSPTIIKSMMRMAKDSIVIEHDGRFFWPCEALIKELMGISQKFKLDCVSGEIGGEILGQSICVNHHDSIIRSVKRHIDVFFESSYKTA